MALNTQGLTDINTRIKKIIDDGIKDKLCCGCCTDDQKYVTTLLILRKGIDLDIEFNDLDKANEKIDLVIRLLDGGKDALCGC